jgi:DNA-binding MarR family transcriptional regulator
MTSTGLSQKIATGLSKVGLALKFQSWHAAGEQGLSPTQTQILVMLAATKVGTRPSALAEQLAVKAPTVTDSVSALAAKGLVERTRDPADARASLVVLTAAGRARARASAGWPDFLAVAVDAMNDAEQDVFYRGLLKVIGSLQRAGQIPLSGMCVSCQHFRVGARNHCTLLDVPLPGPELRLDCPEHAPAAAEHADAAWAAFVSH